LRLSSSAHSRARRARSSAVHAGISLPRSHPPGHHARSDRQLCRRPQREVEQRRRSRLDDVLVPLVRGQEVAVAPKHGAPMNACFSSSEALLLTDLLNARVTRSGCSECARQHRVSTRTTRPRGPTRRRESHSAQTWRRAPSAVASSRPTPRTSRLYSGVHRSSAGRPRPSKTWKPRDTRSRLSSRCRASFSSCLDASKDGFYAVTNAHAVTPCERSNTSSSGE
jgi:hypothetical protein